MVCKVCMCLFILQTLSSPPLSWSFCYCSCAWHRHLCLSWASFVAVSCLHPIDTLVRKLLWGRCWSPLLDFRAHFGYALEILMKKNLIVPSCQYLQDSSHFWAKVRMYLEIEFKNPQRVKKYYGAWLLSPLPIVPAWRLQTTFWNEGLKAPIV